MGTLSQLCRRRSDRLRRTIAERSLKASSSEDVLLVHRATASTLSALDAFLRNLDRLAAKRAEIQSRRVRSDDEVFPLFRRPLQPNLGVPEYLIAFDLLVRVLGIAELWESVQQLPDNSVEGSCVSHESPLRRGAPGPR